LAKDVLSAGRSKNRPRQIVSPVIFMNQRQNNSITGAEKTKAVRPLLIASEQLVRNYPQYLNRFLIGLADKVIPSGLICPPGCELDSFFSPEVEVIRHPVFGLPVFWHLNRKVLMEKIERFKPTILHSLCESKAGFTRRLSRQLNLPYVLTVNNLKKRLNMLSFSSRRCGRIIAPAESIAVNLRQLYPKFASRIEQVNIGTFSKDKPKCFSDISRVSGLVTARQFKDVGEFDNLLVAIKQLAVEGHEFMLVIIGEGPAERQLRRLISNLGLSRFVVIVPKLERWGQLLGAGDIFIQPIPSTRLDSFLLEAMSTGVAVAACKGGVDDLIIEDKTAVVFDPGDELSIKAALQKLLNGRDFARKLASGAQKNLRENYSVSEMIASTLQIYREVIDSTD